MFFISKIMLAEKKIKKEKSRIKKSVNQLSIISVIAIAVVGMLLLGAGVESHVFI